MTIPLPQQIVLIFMMNFQNFNVIFIWGYGKIMRQGYSHPVLQYLEKKKCSDEWLVLNLNIMIPYENESPSRLYAVYQIIAENRITVEHIKHFVVSHTMLHTKWHKLDIINMPLVLAHSAHSNVGDVCIGWLREMQTYMSD